MSEQSPFPWCCCDEGDDLASIECAHRFPILIGYMDEDGYATPRMTVKDARRTVLCVNACRNLEDKDLEGETLRWLEHQGFQGWVIEKGEEG